MTFRYRLPNNHPLLEELDRLPTQTEKRALMEEIVNLGYGLKRIGSVPDTVMGDSQKLDRILHMLEHLLVTGTSGRRDAMPAGAAAPGESASDQFFANLMRGVESFGASAAN